MKSIDKFLNSITMYRLTLYYLIGLVGAAVFLSFLGFLSYNPLDILIVAGTAVTAAYLTNLFFARLFKAVTNIESVFITALILTLIVPVALPKSFLLIILVAGFAMASKYLLTVEKKHIFNPAAAAVAMVALLSPEHSATWWVGTLPMLPFVLIGGLLLMRKIRRERLIVTFLTVLFTIATFIAYFRTGSIANIFSTWNIMVSHTALLFFSFVMLTEPLTLPATKKLRGIYAVLVAFLYATPQMIFVPIVFTPELALCAGNIFAYFSGPQYRLMLSLKEKFQISPDTYAFIFDTPRKITFLPGQYMEWTLPHKNTDSRGNRRYFSLASSPTQKELMITVKFYNPSSSYKKMLMNLNTGDRIIASQVAGDFIMPRDFRKPIVFLAGGVGIAPFRSMIEYIIENNLRVNIILVFSNKTPKDILFADLLERARAYGVKTVYTVSDTQGYNWNGRVGRVSAEMIRQDIPDYTKRTFYISGPQLMVQNLEDTLKNMNIRRKNIITDYFPGYAERV